MTKCSLLLVPFLVAIAVSDALPARAAGTLPQSATSVQDKATESTVSGKRALQSKEDTKGAADEERAPNWLQSVPEWLSTMMKKTTNWTARTWKGTAFSMSRVPPKDMVEAKAVLTEMEIVRHHRSMGYRFLLFLKAAWEAAWEAAWKAASKASELTSVLRRRQSHRPNLRKLHEEIYQIWLAAFESAFTVKELKKEVDKLHKKVMDFSAAIEAKKVAPSDFVRPSE